MSLATALSVRFGWQEWEPNPVLVKELRQAVRSNILLSALMFLVGALFLVWVTRLTRADLFPSGMTLIGLQISMTFLAVLTAINLVFVPLYIAIRLAIEREQPGFELESITAMPGWQIVRGKFLTAAYIQLLFFSVVVPFMAAASLLRGVDLPTIFFVLGRLYIAGCLTAQLAIVFGYIPVHVIGKIGIGILLVGALLIVSAILLFFSFATLRVGIGTMMGSLNFWIGSILYVLLAVAAYLPLYASAVAFAVKERRLRHYQEALNRGMLRLP